MYKKFKDSQKNFCKIVKPFTRFQPSAGFHTEKSALVCTTNQMTDFCMKYDTGLKKIK